MFRRMGWGGILCALALGLTACKHAQEEEEVTPITARTKMELTDTQQQQLADAMAKKEGGEYDQALQMFQDLLAQNNTIVTAYVGIGDIYMVKENYEKAEPAYGRAAKLEPRNFDAQYGHGLALQMLGRLVDAVKAYQRALTIQPDNFKANLNIATSYLQMNDPRSAIAFAEHAVDVDPSNGPARVNLGAAYEKVGRNSDAINQYLAALELMDNSPPVMLNLINVLAQEKRYQEAANTAETL
ncbi:MAG TPA: tetratricopeptide repeat protein, partial [Phycisphaerales bacterium]|nr:tetratricopeptide repeat protein [Phycisphaerales bacterium]